LSLFHDARGSHCDRLGVAASCAVQSVDGSREVSVSPLLETAAD
jgi:hypothetical protein